MSEHTERAVIYCRVSTSRQEDDGTSLDTQEAACRSYVAERAYRLDEAHVYRDSHTGSEMYERPQLSRLRQAIRDDEVDVVVCYAIDRLSRKQTHVAVLVDEADRHGARYEFVTEDFERTAVGEFIRNAKAFAAEVEREKIKERTERGRIVRATSGKLIPGNRPTYGYQWADDDKTRLVLDPHTAPIVERIFADIATTETTRSLARKLDDEGIPTPTGGKHWSTATIATIIGRPIYYGDARAFRYRAVKGANGKTVMVLRPEDEHIVIANAAPAILTKELATAAAQRMSRNRSESRRNNRDPEAALLREGYAVCGYCGLNLSAVNMPDRTVYRCNQLNRDRHGCPSFGINAALLDRPVWAKVEEILNDPAIIAAELARLHENDPTVGDVKAVERRLADIERKQRNLIGRLADIEDNDVAALVNAELTSFSQQAKELEQERIRIQRRQEGWRLAQERLADIEAWCKNVAANIQDLTYDQKRLALEAFGVKVHVWKEDHNPRWRLTANINILSQLSYSSSKSPI